MKKIATLFIVLAFALMVSSAVGLVQESRETVTTENSPRICFNAQHWGPASDRFRPCVRVTRLYEDGSVQFKVMDADGTVRYTTGVGALDR